MECRVEAIHFAEPSLPFLKQSHPRHLTWNDALYGTHGRQVDSCRLDNPEVGHNVVHVRIRLACCIPRRT
jgi:hypothetical protein